LNSIPNNPPDAGRQRALEALMQAREKAKTGIMNPKPIEEPASPPFCDALRRFEETFQKAIEMLCDARSNLEDDLILIQQNPQHQRTRELELNGEPTE
jgi:hypothetical protein